MKTKTQKKEAEEVKLPEVKPELSVFELLLEGKKPDQSLDAAIIEKYGSNCYHTYATYLHFGEDYWTPEGEHIVYKPTEEQALDFALRVHFNEAE